LSRSLSTVSLALLLTFQSILQEEERQERERLLKLVEEKQKAVEEAEQKLVSLKWAVPA